MDYFHEKMELVDKINDKLSQFLDKASDISLQESYKELAKCNQFAKEIEKKLTIKNMRKDNTHATDYAALYMCKCQLEMYRHATLLALAFNLQEEIYKQQKSKKKKRHINKFVKTLDEK